MYSDSKFKATLFIQCLKVFFKPLKKVRTQKQMIQVTITMQNVGLKISDFFKVSKYKLL